MINGLAKELESALRPIMSLGRREDVTADLTEARQQEFTHLHGELDRLANGVKAQYFWDGTIYPDRHREYWPSLVELGRALRDWQARGHDGHEYPPQTKGNERREWGIANALYGEPWLATKSGFFLCRQPMDISQGSFPPKSRLATAELTQKKIKAGRWVDILAWREEVFTFFEFAQSWSREFGPNEKMSVKWQARIKGLHLVSRTLERFVEMIEPSVAGEYRFTRTLTAEQFQAGWKDICVEAIDAFVELFPPTMGQEFQSSREWVVSGRGASRLSR